MTMATNTLIISEPIAKDYKTCVCPFIDVIDFENFQYRAQDEGARGGFDWEFFYKRLPLLPEDLKHPTEPFKYVNLQSQIPQIHIFISILGVPSWREDSLPLVQGFSGSLGDMILVS